MGKWDSDYGDSSNGELFDDPFVFSENEEDEDEDDDVDEGVSEASDDLITSLEAIAEFLPHSSLEIEECLISGEIDEHLALDIADAVRRFRERVID